MMHHYAFRSSCMAPWIPIFMTFHQKQTCLWDAQILLSMWFNKKDNPKPLSHKHELNLGTVMFITYRDGYLIKMKNRCSLCEGSDISSNRRHDRYMAPYNRNFLWIIIHGLGIHVQTNSDNPESYFGRWPLRQKFMKICLWLVNEVNI